MSEQILIDRLQPSAFNKTYAFDLVDQARIGISYDAAVRAAESYGIPEGDLHTFLGSSSRTIQRRKKAGGKLTPQETTNLFESLRLLARVQETFGGNTEYSWRWLNAHILSIEGRRPIDLFDTSIGRREVEHLLIRIEHGVHG